MEKRSDNTPSFTWIYPAVLAAVAVPTFAIGIYLAATHRGWAMLAAGCGSIVATLIAWPLARTMEAARAANLRCLNDMMVPLDERMQQMNVMLNQISEQQLISDRTKAIAYRAKDRDVLRRAIHEEIAAKDWEMATALANDMERVFGYREEADRFRRDIEQKRGEMLRKQIAEAVQAVDRHVRAEKWTEALAEAHKIAQQWPGDEQAHNLPQQIEDRRAAHKRQLIESWQDAISRRDIDGGIEIVRKLDPYLTPQEAEAMQEPVRNLFKEKLNSLRTQFTLAIQEHNGREALRLSDIIIRDFPNTRIAQEVRETMEALRDRAAEWESETTAASA